MSQDTNDQGRKCSVCGMIGTHLLACSAGKPDMPKLDHPCKQTCSGWRQGYEYGLASAHARIVELTARACEVESKVELYYLTHTPIEELITARQEIERLKETHKHQVYERLCLERTQANSRIKELEAELKQWGSKDYSLAFENARLKEHIKELETETKRLEFNRAAFNKVEDDLALMLERDQKLVAALGLVLYYVEGDATYEGLVERIKERFGIDAKAHRGEGVE